jgi:vancomycin permeability regulator SanA
VDDDAAVTVPGPPHERPADPAPGVCRPGASWRRRLRHRIGSRRFLRRSAILSVLGVLVLTAPSVWTYVASDGHVYTVDSAPRAPVAIVFGAQLESGGTQPRSFLRGRLVTAAELLRSGKVHALLVSGDANGFSGNEVAVMSRYLAGLGVPADRIVTDPYGLDSYDTCRRAHLVYGVTRALLVSQRLHLPRALTLCRTEGIDADGVAARCDSCQRITWAYNSFREILADYKAVYDVASGRPPAVSSPPDPALTEAAKR